MLQGRPVTVFGDPDAPHSWTHVPDIASALITLGTDDRAWGRPWHVPTNPPLSQRQVYVLLARIAGAPPPKVRTLPAFVLRLAGLFVPFLRELEEVRYQFDRPFVVDSSAFEETFGVRPTAMNDALAATVAWWRDQR